MLTSPLALRQEPFGRSVEVRPLGWRPSPKRYKPGVKQVDGVEEPVRRGVVTASPNTDEGTLTRVSGVRKDRTTCRWSWWSISSCGLAPQRTQGGRGIY